MLAPFGNPVFAPFFALTFVVATVFQQFAVTLPVTMAARGVPPSDYGRVIALNGVLIVLIQPFTTRWLARYDRGAVLALASLLVGLGFGATELARTVWSYGATVVVWTLGEIIMSPVNAAVVADLAPPHARGRYQGAFQIAWGVSFFVSPALGSLVLGRFGSAALWSGCAIVGALAAAGHLAIAGPRRRRLSVE